MLQERVGALTLVVALLGGCGAAGDKIASKLAEQNEQKVGNAVSLNVTSFGPAAKAPGAPRGWKTLEASAEPAFTNPPSAGFAPFINSAPPDYLKITILEIAVQGDWGEDVLWSGEKELLIDGGPVDITDMTSALKPVHMGRATKIRTTFKSQAKVKGSLTGDFSLDASSATHQSMTVYTKAAYAYSAVSHTGGADSYAAFTAGPAEEMEISIAGDRDTFLIDTPCDTDVVTGTTLTILFDLNRLLRFYDGKNTTHGGGVNPSDPNDKAYFFGHSLLGSFIAPFFGKPGTIEGYRAIFSAGNPGTPGQYMLVNSWMTLVFDADNQFMSGMLMGDDDNALTVAKGRVQTFTDGDSFTYDISQGTVTGFSRLATVGDWTTPIPAFATTGVPSQGESKFQLVLKQ